MPPSAIDSLVVPWFIRIQARFILSRGHSSSECLQLGARSYLSMRALPARIPALSRHHCTASTYARGSKSSLRSALRCSQPLGGLLRCAAHGLVSSRSRAQGSSPFEGLSTPRSDRLSSSSSAPSPLPRDASPASEWPAFSSLDLEAFIHAGPRAVRLVVSRPPGRSLLRILRFPQVLSKSRSLSSSVSGAHDVRPFHPSCSQAITLGGSVAPPAHWQHRAWSSPSPVKTTCSNFVAVEVALPSCACPEGTLAFSRTSRLGLREDPEGTSHPLKRGCGSALPSTPPSAPFAPRRMRPVPRAGLWGEPPAPPPDLPASTPKGVHRPARRAADTLEGFVTSASSSHSLGFRRPNPPPLEPLGTRLVLGPEAVLQVAEPRSSVLERNRQPDASNPALRP